MDLPDHHPEGRDAALFRRSAHVTIAPLRRGGTPRPSALWQRGCRKDVGSRLPARSTLTGTAMPSRIVTSTYRYKRPPRKGVAGRWRLRLGSIGWRPWSRVVTWSRRDPPASRLIPSQRPRRAFVVRSAHDAVSSASGLGRCPDGWLSGTSKSRGDIIHQDDWGCGSSLLRDLDRRSARTFLYPCTDR